MKTVVRVYNNNDRVNATMPDASVEHYLAENAIARPGYAIFVDGECRQYGHLNANRCREWEIKLKAEMAERRSRHGDHCRVCGEDMCGGNLCGQCLEKEHADMIAALKNFELDGSNPVEQIDGLCKNLGDATNRLRQYKKTLMQVCMGVMKALDGVELSEFQQEVYDMCTDLAMAGMLNTQDDEPDEGQERQGD